MTGKTILPGEEGSKYLRRLGSKARDKRVVLPYTGGIVEGRVIFSGLNEVSVRLLKVDGEDLPLEVNAVIQKEDSCFAFKDDMKLSRMFRPEDVVTGKILSLGGAGSIKLSTVDDKHGVVGEKGQNKDRERKYAK